MAIKFNNTTFSNGGTANFVNGGSTTSLTSIKVSINGGTATEVWKKQQTFAGGSLSWNDIEKSHTGTYATLDLRGFSTISFNLSGYIAYSGTSMNCTFRLLYSNGSTQTLATYTSNETLNRNFSITLSGSESVKGTVKLQCLQNISYTNATGVYNYNQTTVGTITAS